MLRLMCITAHPDDEAGGFGGVLRLYADRGVETCVLCLTPGQAATYRGGAKDDHELATMRRKEFAASCEILRVSRGIVLDYPDGHLHRQDLYRVVRDLILQVRGFCPQVVLTFGPEGGVTAHSDHSMASLYATLAFHWAGRENCFPDQFGSGVTAHRAQSFTTPLSTSPCRTGRPWRFHPLLRPLRSGILSKPSWQHSKRTPARRRCGRCSKKIFVKRHDRRDFIWRLQSIRGRPWRKRIYSRGFTKRVDRLAPRAVQGCAPLSYSYVIVLTVTAGKRTPYLYALSAGCARHTA